MKLLEQEIAHLRTKSKIELSVCEMHKLVKGAHPVLRLAGLSGATAVILGAYGAHGMYV